MHQPDYRDAQGIMRMPWVFLHAIKDYYDMPWMLSKFPQLKASFNITPPLIEQLKLYQEPLKNDYFLSLWSKDPSRLSPSEQKWLIKICKSTNFETMVEPLPRYKELYEKTEMEYNELIDLEMLFLLSWCGHYLRIHDDLIRDQLKKGDSYTAEDKEALLATLVKFIAGIIPFYTQLMQSGQIAVSTTPYNHPILPLLIDMDNVKRANTYTNTPDNPISLKDDAVEQVKRAIALYKETFHTDPVGFWPAEGAVDEESVAIYKSLGIKWIATDEAILFKSLGTQERSKLYKPYSLEGVDIYFRDHVLSDLFGFDYRFKSPYDAVDHLFSSLENLVSVKNDRTVFIILDGENAWEYYLENGYPFFTQLYERLSVSAWCHTVTMDEISMRKKSTPLPRLASGSWIWGDFSTWSGHPEKNRAWELIFQTKRDQMDCTNIISPEAEEQIKSHFLAAECSDWFWWYGDDHYTDFALEFDTLFRRHLISIYELLGIKIPAALFVPIITIKSGTKFLLQPKSHIHPLIDGKLNSFFEWIGCGTIDEDRIFTTMDRLRGPIRKIRFGHNEEMGFVAFEGDTASLKKATMALIVEELSKTFYLPLRQSASVDGIRLGIDKSIEIELPKELFGDHQRRHFRFEIELEGKIIQTLPGYGSLRIDLDENYNKNWFI